MKCTKYLSAILLLFLFLNLSVFSIGENLVAGETCEDSSLFAKSPTVSTTVFHSGSGSIKLKCTSNYATDSQFAAAYEPFKTYFLSFWIKKSTADGSPTKISPVTKFSIDGVNSSVTKTAVPLAATDEWQRVTTTVAIDKKRPNNGDVIAMGKNDVLTNQSVYLAPLSATNEIYYIDDIEMREIPADSTVFVSSLPENNAEDVEMSPSLAFTYNYPLDKWCTDALSVSVNGTPAAKGSVHAVVNDKTLTLDFLTPLAADSEYSVTVSGIKDAFGRNLADTGLSFTTGSEAGGVTIDDVNLIAGEACEDSSYFVAGSSDPAVVVSTDVFHSGSGSLQLNCAGTWSMLARSNAAYLPLKTYHMSAWVKKENADANPTSLTPVLRFSTDGVKGSVPLTAVNLTAANDWQRIESTFTVTRKRPNNGSYINLTADEVLESTQFYFAPGSSDGSVFYIDDIELYEVPEASTALLSVFPADGAEDVDTALSVRFSFDHLLDKWSVGDAVITVNGKTAEDGDVFAYADGNELIIGMNDMLTFGETYTVEVSGLHDVFGRAAAGSLHTTFTTAADADGVTQKTEDDRLRVTALSMSNNDAKPVFRITTNLPLDDETVSGIALRCGEKTLDADISADGLTVSIAMKDTVTEMTPLGYAVTGILPTELRFEFSLTDYSILTPLSFTRSVNGADYAVDEYIPGVLNAGARIANRAEETMPVTLIFAAFDREGRLMKLTFDEAVVMPGEKTTLDASLDTSDIAKGSVRAYLMNGMTPLCESTSLEYADELRVLAIGNSYSGNATEYLTELGLGGGIAIHPKNMFKSGCTLKEHWTFVENGSHPYTGDLALVDMLAPMRWDVITFQQGSHESADYGYYQPYLDKLTAYVRIYQPQARFMVHQTWAYDDAHAASRLGLSGRAEMFSGIKNAYDRMAADMGGAPILPSGTAVQAALDEYGFTDAEIYSGDDYNHLSAAGRYLIGMVWYEAITGKSAAGNTFVPGGVSAADAAVLREIAHNVVTAYGYTVS